MNLRDAKTCSDTKRVVHRIIVPNEGSSIALHGPSRPLVVPISLGRLPLPRPRL